MTDSEDWEPLRSDQLAAHPGELVDVSRQTKVPETAPAAASARDAVRTAESTSASTTESPAPCPPPRRRRSAPLAPEAEKALQELKSKLAARPAAQSLIAEVQRREEKRERKLRAAQAPELAAAIPVRLSIAVPAGSEEEAANAVDFGRDPREHEAWFLGLPAPERERLIAAWGARREQLEVEKPGQRRAKRDRFVAAILLFAAVMLIGSGSYWLATLGAGVVCGIWWRNVPACRFRDPIVALVCFVLGQMLAYLVSTDTMAHPGLVNDVLLLIPFGALLGFSGEMRRTGGFDAD
jgi:hypothetical protein